MTMICDCGKKMILIRQIGLTCQWECPTCHTTIIEGE